MNALQGVVMELNDCASPLLHRIEITDDPMVAFRNVDYAFLWVRVQEDRVWSARIYWQLMRRFFRYKAGLNAVASRDVKVW